MSGSKETKEMSSAARRDLMNPTETHNNEGITNALSFKSCGQCTLALERNKSPTCPKFGTLSCDCWQESFRGFAHLYVVRVRPTVWLLAGKHEQALF